MDILFVEDEPTIAMAVSEALLLNGYKVTHVTTGEKALEVIKYNHPDLCIVDVMLPGISGFELAEEMIALHYEIPVIFLTARTDLNDVLHGFRVGADDYLKKPFSLQELLARVNAVLQRNKTVLPETTRVRFGGYLFDKVSQFIEKPNREKHNLSYRETQLFNLLLSNKNNVLNRGEALKQIWGDDNFFNARTMDVFISRLRKCFKDDPTVKILNVRGVGYKFIVEE